jgi:para-aminobenzoate synthetase/4-amino-4-deoxychorismate lyase
MQDRLSGLPRWLLLQRPTAVIASNRLSEVMGCFLEIGTQTALGLYAAGFVSYEASAAMDSAFDVHAAEGLPLIWFGLYDRYEIITLPARRDQAFHLRGWQPSAPVSEYCESIAEINRRIGQGDTYQVNYTFRLRSAFRGNPWGLFLELNSAQPSGYSAYINLGRYHVCSVSPELFFSLEHGKLTCKPMKGTAKRGATTAEDRKQQDWLSSSQKNRAENVMIVDVIRNDMGRIAEPGTVHVDELFAIEKLPTVFQMTSTITSRTTAPISEVFRQMFPCASITGAPKIKTMQIIKQLERDPRGVYTGSIGYISPQSDAQFNVAIRTVVIDEYENTAEYGVGGGITGDSDADDEYEECLTKAGVLLHRYPEIDLIETLLWTENLGYYLLDQHLERLEDSAEYFQFHYSIDELRKKLAQVAIGSVGQRRVRLALSRCGKANVESSPLVSIAGTKVALAWRPISDQTPYLYHKTTYRKHYADLIEGDFARQVQVADLIAWNEAGFITESGIANVVIGDQGELFTPPLKHGLLAGVFRQYLMQQGVVQEKDIRVDDLRRAQFIYLVNSVRGWMPLDRSALDDIWIIRSDLSFKTPQSIDRS